VRKLAVGLYHQCVEFDPARLSHELQIRPVIDGDKIRLADTRTRKVRDIMTEFRIPKAARDGWPIVSAGRDIVWLPGMAVAAGVEAKPCVGGRVRLTWRGLRV
jgi:tRNA(Ile)-lysidine synthase